MASSWMLLLAVLGGACALPAPEPFAYTQALAQAVNSYNQRPEVKNAFRLLSAEPQPEPGVELSSLQAFNFSMMETECAASARSDPEDCDFKENGSPRSGSWVLGVECRAPGGEFWVRFGCGNMGEVPGVGLWIWGPKCPWCGDTSGGSGLGSSVGSWGWGPWGGHRCGP
uniref:CTHL2 protein n=1 Tax=Catharus ustulatus TaxID=91951 RepID=A0A8C3U0E2_CATUS